MTLYVTGVTGPAAPLPLRSPLREVSRELKVPAPVDPPTFRDVAGQRGWCEAADRINRWTANGYEGHWTDAEYDDPSPIDLKDGAL